MSSFVGKVIAGVLGYLVLGPVGLLFGLVVGHAFDRGLWQALQATGPAGLLRIRSQFFDTAFTLMGFIAKADGRVSEAEIAQAESFFRQLRMAPSQRQSAIEHFKRGAALDFELEPLLKTFMAGSGGRRDLSHTLMVFLIPMALADGQLDPQERAALHRIAVLMNRPPAEVDRMIAMMTAQQRFHTGGGQGAGPTSSRSSLADAYNALGVEADASDAAVKKAYRKLMSENHPDRLMAKGVPEDLLRMATERSQEISNAYQLIREQRGLR